MISPAAYMDPVSSEEAVHFRGKTLTPASPRPIHIPEPANIPVLENQMDPSFNDTATYNIPANPVPSTPNIEPPYGGQLNLAHQLFTLQQSGNVLGSTNNNNAGTSEDRGVDPAGEVHSEATRNELSFSDDPNSLPSKPFPSAVPQPTARGDSSNTAQPPNSPPHTGTASSQNSHLQPLNNNAIDAPAEGPSSMPTFPGASADTKEEPQSEHGSILKPNNSIDYQALLSVLSSVSSAPNTVAPTPSSSAKPNPESSLPGSNSLPPRPPPPEKHAINSKYSSVDSIQAFHPYPSQAQGSQAPSTFFPPQSSAGPKTNAGDFPPPRPAPAGVVDKPNGATKLGEAQDLTKTPDDAPWPPEIQKKYDEFLHVERIYVTEGQWDRFAPGSRLFVGNLPTERVTKRDLFHRFHKYGRLAQISIKQAYGFIQFVEPEACRAALKSEEGGLIRGRKIHLEISKPQRPTRGGSDAARGSGVQRPRSPERGRGPGRPLRLLGDRDRDDVYRPRDDYRPGRSPSPPPRRARYRSRTPERFRFRERSRSTHGRGGRYRSRSPRSRGGYDDMDLPLPRRAPHQVPDVQIIVLDDVKRNFMIEIEQAFRERGLKTDVIFLSPRIQLSDVIRRQVVEGVLAISRINRRCEYSGKIPLEVFERMSGPDDTRTTDYSELPLNVAADVLLRARVTKTQRYPGFLPGAPPTPLQAPNNLSNLISTLDGPALQSLIAALQQNNNPFAQAQQPQQPAWGGQPDLTSLLLRNNQATYPVTPFGLPTSSVAPPVVPPVAPQVTPPIAPSANLANLLAQQPSRPAQTQQGPAQVQNIIDQLSRWKR